MGKIRFKLDYGSGFVIKPPPKNSQGLTISLLWNGQNPDATVNGTDFIWTGINATELQARRKNGLTGGVGIMEGVGLQIEMECGANNWFRFYDGYINLADSKTKFECDQVTAPCVETGKIDWFNNKIKSLSFGYLASLTGTDPGRIIPATDYKLIPYHVRKYTHANLETALLALSEFAILKQGLEVVRDIASIGTETTGDAATSALQAGTNTPTVVADITRIVYDVVYLAGSIVALIGEGQKIIDSVWQSKRYKLCMLESTHWQRLCDALGVQFSSTIYSSGIHVNETWIPKKTIIPDLSNPNFLFKRSYDESDNFPNNPNVYGHYDGNCSSFVKTMCDKYNASVSIMTNPNTGVKTLYFEEVHYWNTQSVFKIPNSDTPGYTHNLPDPVRTNLSELPFNYLIAFATDISDEGTIYRYTGTMVEKTIVPNIVNNKLRTIRGKGVQVNLECALAKRKDYLNGVEDFLNVVINGIIAVGQFFINVATALYNSIAWVVNLFGGNMQPLTPFQLPNNILNNRLGWLELSADTFQIPKSFIGVASGTDWKIDQFNEINCSAIMLMNQYHSRNLPTHGNQQDLYDNKQFKICCSDFVALLNKNVVTAPDGIRKGKLIKLDWDTHTENAKCDYAIYTNETNNLTEKTIVDGN